MYITSLLIIHLYMCKGPCLLYDENYYYYYYYNLWLMEIVNSFTMLFYWKMQVM